MEIILLTDYRGALRQQEQIWQSLDVGALSAALAARGIATRVVRFEQVASGEIDPAGSIIHYTSTQDTGYRTFVDDILHHLQKNNTLVPRYEIFRCHENKGYQELEKRRLGMEGLGCRYFGNRAAALQAAADLTFPLVLKPAGGFMSSGVTLVRSREELDKILKDRLRPAGYGLYRGKEWLKKNILKGRYHAEMYSDCVHTGSFVLQEFAPDLDHDWKVLIYGDRIFALQRGTLPGDFRASGSGRLSFPTPPDAVLDFGADMKEALDAPLLSLDIIETAQGCRLVEFQGLHFGTATHRLSRQCYEKGTDGWKARPHDTTLEEDTAHALHLHLREKGLTTP